MIPEIFQGANGIVRARLASEGAGSVLGTGQGGISHGKKKGVGPGERTRILGSGLLQGSPDGNHRLLISQLTERKTGMFSGEKWGGFGISPLNSPQKSPLKNGSWGRTSDKFSEKPRLVQLPGGNSKLYEKPKAGISCRTKPPWNATLQEQPVPKKIPNPSGAGEPKSPFWWFFFLIFQAEHGITFQAEHGIIFQAGNRCRGSSVHPQPGSGYKFMPPLSRQEN